VRPTLGHAPAPARPSARTRYITANNNPYDILDPHQVFDIGRIAIRLNMYDALVRWVDNPPKLETLAGREGRHLSRRPDLHLQAAGPANVPRRQRHHRRGRGLVDGAHPGAARRAPTACSPASSRPAPPRPSTPAPFASRSTKPFAVFMAGALRALGRANAKVVKANEKDGDWGADWLTRNEAGSGGYKLRRFDPAIGFQVERNTAHFMPWARTRSTTPTSASRWKPPPACSA
jgi:peptide/nickel transport system substrate-binding protein